MMRKHCDKTFDNDNAYYAGSGGFIILGGDSISSYIYNTMLMHVLYYLQQ